MASEDALAELTGELYGVLPAEFVPARNALAKRLKTEGKRELAGAVGKLRRPTPAAWAVNQLSRNDRGSVEELLRRGEQLRAAQARALAGAPARELRDAGRARREALVAAAEAAVRFLAERGLGVDAHRQEIADTLDAASLDPQAAEAVLGGQLTSGLEPPSGFGDLEGSLAASLGTAPAPAAGSDAVSPELAEAERAVARARRDAEELAARAEASAGRAERRRREVEDAEAEVARLERALHAARRHAQLAAEDAEAAERAAAEAREAAARAAAELDEAEARLREAGASG
jgi:hypothetical protein